MSIKQEKLSVEIRSELLDTTEPYKFDETFKYKKHIAIQPPSQNILNEPIVLNSFYQDGYFQPSESYIVFKGHLKKADGGLYNNEEISLVNNAMLYLFDSVQYSISDTDIETVQWPGHASTIMGLLTFPDDFSTSSGLSHGWAKDTTNGAQSYQFKKQLAKTINVTGPDAGQKVVTVPENAFLTLENPDFNKGFALRKNLLLSSTPKGKFCFTIPFSHLFGLSEYKKIVYGVQQTLTLHRGGDDLAIHRRGDHPGKVELTNITWYIPKYELNTAAQVDMTNRCIAKIELPISFRARTCKKIAIPAGSTSFEWPLSVKTGLEKPRYVIMGLQSGRTTQTETPAVFDNLGLTKAYVTLNDTKYPDIDVTTNFAENDYAQLYKMMNDFKKDFYGYDELIGGSQIDFFAFKTLFPILIFDLTKQGETIKTGAIDMRITLNYTGGILPDGTASVGAPANTMAYALIISDRLFALVSDGKTITQLIN